MSKKLLIREIFEKGKRESGKDSKNGIAVYLWSYFEDKMDFHISDKTLVRYNDAFLRDNKDVNIDSFTLDKMSQYLDFKDYKDFCNTSSFTKTNEDSSFTSVKVSIDDEGNSGKINPNITVNITTNPILKLQEFFAKHSNLGIIGVVLCGSLVVGNKIYKADEIIPKETQIQDSVFQGQIPIVENPNAKTVIYVPQSFANIPVNKEEKPIVDLPNYMYWDGEKFVKTSSSYLGSEYDVVPMNEEKFKYFKKITTPDTISEKSLNKVWYSKHQNVVEFFTADGRNPENGKELRILSHHMFEKYIKKE